jgi:murein DD-endopeptidase MepM/ murein hydrolase activator NlpD
MGRNTIMITKLIRPVESPHKVTSGYGPRVLNGKRQLHDGIDYVSRNSKNVLAIADGYVVTDVDYYKPSLRWTDRRHSAGNMVIIKHKIHGKEYFVRYLHLVRNRVEEGLEVQQGETIGIYGDAGISYGPHLHLDMYTKGWVKVDPTPILLKGLK